jgi:2'-5' RNA ligase
VAPASVHLTLEFLGEVADADVARVRDALGSLRGAPRVEARLGRVGAFPGPGRARVLWVGLESQGALEALARRVRDLTAALGLPRGDSKPFVAHLTLARFRRPCALRHVELEGDSRDTGGGRCLIQRVIFLHSLLSPAGAEYRSLCEIPLGGGPSA